MTRLSCSQATTNAPKNTAGFIIQLAVTHCVGYAKECPVITAVMGPGALCSFIRAQAVVDEVHNRHFFIWYLKLHQKMLTAFSARNGACCTALLASHDDFLWRI